MEAQHRTIATILLAACPPGEERGQPKFDPAGSFRIAEAVTEVRDATPGRATWSHTTFTAARDGTFKLDVGHPAGPNQAAAATSDS